MSNHTEHAVIAINDAVAAARDATIGKDVVRAYVGASRLGFRILAGIAAVQFVLCLGLREVKLDDGSKNEEVGIEMDVRAVGAVEDREDDKDKVGSDVVETRRDL